MSITRKATAYHEAGHAVVAFWLGLRIDSATIVPGSDYAGMVKYRPRGRFDLTSSTATMRLKIEHYIMATLAGDIAQRRFNPRSARRWHTTGDRQTAVDLALNICGSGESATAFIAWLHIRVKAFVEARWPVVEKVAHLLLERETLTGEEIQAAILPSSQSR